MIPCTFPRTPLANHIEIVRTCFGPARLFWRRNAALALVTFLCAIGVGQAKDVGGTVAQDTRWRAAEGPYRLTNGVIVAEGVTLTIEPGTAVHLAATVDLVITNGARLLAVGTPDSPIRFTSPPGESTRWGGIVVCGNEGSPETRIAHAHIEGNNFSAIYSQGGTLVVEHCSFGSPDRQYLSLDESSFVISDCHFPATTGAFELIHGSRGIKEGGRAIIQRCFFGGGHGYNDLMDFTGGNRDRNQPILQLYNNVFAKGSDDGVDLDGTDAWIEGNIFLHIHKNGTPDTASAISGGNNRRLNSQVTVVGNLFYDCDQAATSKQGNFFTMLHNTIVKMTKVGGEDYSDGAICARDTEPELTTYGEGVYLEANILFDVEQLVRNYATGETAVTFINNILPKAWEGPGGSNTVADPKLTYIPKLEETYFTNWASAQIFRKWFRPQAGSPALGRGPHGRDLGGVVPMGVAISGEPTTATDQQAFSLNVGFNRSGHGIPEDGWPQGAGYTHYKWRLDGGAWSAEMPIASPLAIDGLSRGEHYVEVVGKRDSGFYQNDPQFGPDAVVTKSRRWTVR